MAHRELKEGDHVGTRIGHAVIVDVKTLPIVKMYKVEFDNTGIVNWYVASDMWRIE